MSAGNRQSLRNWIEPARVERVTFGETARTQPDTTNETIPLDRLEGVLRAARSEPAPRSEGGRDESLVASDQNGAGATRPLHQTRFRDDSSASSQLPIAARNSDLEAR
jgi:hypothetical protein